MLCDEFTENKLCLTAGVPVVAPPPSLLFLCHLLQILERLNKMCSSGVWKKQQRLLKNMGAHKVMLDLLQVSYDQVRRAPVM